MMLGRGHETLLRRAGGLLMTGEGGAHGTENDRGQVPLRGGELVGQRPVVFRADGADGNDDPVGRALLALRQQLIDAGHVGDRLGGDFQFHAQFLRRVAHHFGVVGLAGLDVVAGARPAHPVTIHLRTQEDRADPRLGLAGRRIGQQRGCQAEQPWRRQGGNPHRGHEIAAVHRSTTTATIGRKTVLVTHRQVSCVGVGKTGLEGRSTKGGTRRTTPLNLSETADQRKLLAVRGRSNGSETLGPRRVDFHAARRQTGSTGCPEPPGAEPVGQLLDE